MRTFSAGLAYGFVACLLLTVALTWTRTPVSAGPSGVTGGGDLGQNRTTFRFKNLQNNERFTTIERTEVAVPLDYGKLVEIASDGQATNLWFVDDVGVLRNVILEPGLFAVPGLETVWGDGGKE